MQGGYGGGGRPAPRRLRASDQDRDDAVTVLRRATTEGYLTLVEFEERLDAAFSSRYVDELDALLADVPGARTAPAVPGRAAPRIPAWSPGLARRILRPCLGALMVLLVLAVIANFWIPLMVIGFVCWRRNHHRYLPYGRRRPLEYI